MDNYNTEVSFLTKQNLKERVDGIFNTMGITTDYALNTFYEQIAEQGQLPLTSQQEEQLINTISADIISRVPAGKPIETDQDLKEWLDEDQ